MIVYHGSRNHFNEFDANRIGENGTKEGKGFYFTDTPRIARNYGENGYVYHIRFDGKRPLGTDHHRITRVQLKKLLRELHKQTDYLSNWGEVAYEGFDCVMDRAIENEMETTGNDVDLIGALCNASGNTPLVLQLVYKLLGYDSIVQKADWGGEQTIYIALTGDIIEIQKIEKWKKLAIE